METANEEAQPPRMRQAKEHTPPSPHLRTNTACDSIKAHGPAVTVAPPSTSPKDDDSPNGSATASGPLPSRKLETTTSETIRSPSIVPPYWQHYRNASYASQVSVEGPNTPLITLEDHTEDPTSEATRGLWASSVTIDDHVIVKGISGIGAYVVWTCKIQTLDVRVGYLVIIPSPVDHNAACTATCTNHFTVGWSYGNSDEVRLLRYQCLSSCRCPFFCYTDTPNLMSSEPDLLWLSRVRRTLSQVSHRRVLFVRTVDEIWYPANANTPSSQIQHQVPRSETSWIAILS